MISIEVSGSAIRWCRDNRGSLAALESFPIPAGGDPLAALAQAPLPRPLGKVRLLLHHPDMLLRTMIQPACPIDRLDRIIRFEIQGMAREDGEPVAVSWHLVRAMGASGDMRVLVMLTKRRLIADIQRALAAHGGKLAALVPPAVGMHQAYRRQEAEAQGEAALIDIGGKNLHLALTIDGELVFMRAQQPGMDELCQRIAELRGIPVDEAARLVAKLGKGAPADLHDLIRRQAQAIAGMVSNNLRFAKAQLRLDAFEPKVIWLSGAGAQVHGLREALAERLQAPVRLLNPFAGAASAIAAEEMDRQAALPSAWTSVVGAAHASDLPLDAISEDRQRRVAFWKSDGALRAGAGAAAALLVLAWLLQWHASASAAGVVARLGDSDKGLVPVAQKQLAELAALRADQDLAASRLAFLDGERRPGRVAVELLAAIAEQQDPVNCPVVLRAFHVSRVPGEVQVEIEGFAETAGKLGTGDVLRQFECQLVRRYEPITELKQLPPGPISKNHQEFHYQIGIADKPTQVLAKDRAGKSLRIKVKADDAADAGLVAAVMVDRYREAEEEATIEVDGARDGGSFHWTPRGLERR